MLVQGFLCTTLVFAQGDTLPLRSLNCLFNVYLLCLQQFRLSTQQAEAAKCSDLRAARSALVLPGTAVLETAEDATGAGALRTETLRLGNQLCKIVQVS